MDEQEKLQMSDLEYVRDGWEASVLYHLTLRKLRFKHYVTVSSREHKAFTIRMLDILKSEGKLP